MNRLTAWTLALMLGSSALLHGGTRLSKAAIDGNIKDMQARIGEGEKVNELDKWGWSPLTWAVLYNLDNTVNWLLKNGADPNLKTTKSYDIFPVGTTALGIAARNSKSFSVAMLLTAKANPDSVDSKGFSPISYAKFGENFEILAQLRGRPLPQLTLHSVLNPQLKDGLDSVCIRMNSSIKNSESFLDDVKFELEGELLKKKVRHFFWIPNPANPEDEKQFAAKLATYKPKFILLMTETSLGATSFGLAGRSSADGSREYSTFLAVLRRWEDPNPLWVRDCGAGPGFDLTPEKKVAKSLLESLETDLLLQP